MNYVSAWLSALLFWGFIAVKTGGTSFAAWSWWWVFLPIVPWLSLVVKRLHL